MPCQLLSYDSPAEKCPHHLLGGELSRGRQPDDGLWGKRGNMELCLGEELLWDSNDVGRWAVGKDDGLVSLVERPVSPLPGLSGDILPRPQGFPFLLRGHTNHSRYEDTGCR